MKLPLVLAGLALTAGTALTAQTPAAPSAAEMEEMARAQAAYRAMPDTPGTGPFPAIKEMARSLPKHTIYRPANLAAVKEGTLGVVGWGNGGCSPDGASSRLHLAEIASHGYVVIAPGEILSGPGIAPPPPPPERTPSEAEPPRLVAETSAKQVWEGVEWALAENARPGSPLHNLIDPEKIAVAGFSCGGLQALELAGKPSVKAVLIHNSGIFPEGTQPMSGMETTKAWLDRLHTPVVYILGGPTDIAYENGMDDFRRIDHVPVAMLNQDTGHGGTFLEPNGGAAAEVAVAWLEWQLRGDQEAGKLFTGEECGLCADDRWKLERKNFTALDP